MRKTPGVRSQKSVARRVLTALIAAAFAGVSLWPQDVITNPGPGNPTTYMQPGTTFAINSAAVIDGLGRIGAAQGSPGNCVLVNGSSGPCGFSGTILPTQILGGGATSGQALIWNGTNYVPTNQSSGGGGGGTFSLYNESTLIGTRAGMNFLQGAGFTVVLSDTGTLINAQIIADTSFLASIATVQGGTLAYAASASGSGTAYTACPSGAIPGELTPGMTFNWVPDANGAGGATTMNFCTLSSGGRLYQADGATNPSAISIVAGEMYTVWYDGTNFRLKDVHS